MKKILLPLLAVTALFAYTKKYTNTVTIEGKIAVYGNEPHTFLAIKDKANTLYKVMNAKEYNLYKLQNHIIKVDAIKLKEKAAPGFPAVIKIVKIY